ncbi:hypothetical protein Tco_0135135 [Tanacetum coccineum]
MFDDVRSVVLLEESDMVNNTTSTSSFNHSSSSSFQFFKAREVEKTWKIDDNHDRIKMKSTGKDVKVEKPTIVN